MSLLIPSLIVYQTTSHRNSDKLVLENVIQLLNDPQNRLL